MINLQPVRVLPQAEARRIAAGEVIDRPYAAVRELLDNSIDSGAREITLSLTGGGADEIRVTDDGCGMSGEDLELCWLPHATSKISKLSDLEEVDSLGFRGEALSSLAACSRLEILSSRDGEGRSLTVHGGRFVELIPKGGAPGTVVSVRNLFFNMPARRRFLKGKQAESRLCRRIVLEKAIAHPDIVFRFFAEGELKMFLPPGSITERINTARPSLAPSGAWWESRGEGDGFQLTVAHARPEVTRKNRQHIQIYVNRRRIDEFSLLQGVCHAYDPWMPGGSFPVALVFININPVLVDFNIHPAKKEARFRDIQALRHRLVETIRGRLTGESYRSRAEKGELKSEQPSLIPSHSHRRAVASPRANYAAPPPGEGPSEQRAAERFVRTAARIRDEKSQRQQRNSFPEPPLPSASDFHYLGQVMGVFLLAESGSSLFIVDQHAAHERILFDEFRGTPPVSERLLIPRRLELDRSALMRLELRREKLTRLGVELTQDGEGHWCLSALPQTARNLEDDVAAFLESGEADAEGLEKSLWADLACKAAVKDNSPLDDEAARRILAGAFALESPHCPHGRPIWFEVSRDELFELVGRTG